jgi:hypothetical protein
LEDNGLAQRAVFLLDAGYDCSSIISFLSEAKCSFIIRGTHNRALRDRKAAGFSCVKDKLEASSLSDIDIRVRRSSQSHEMRVARVEVQAANVELCLNSSDEEDLGKPKAKKRGSQFV